MKTDDKVEAENAARREGSPDSWDSIWQKLDTAEERKPFTRNQAKTIKQFWQRAYFEDLVIVCQPQTNWRFLELASGRGTTSLYLAAHGFTDITLLDLSSTALEQARENFISENVPLPRLVLANALETGLSADSYDCVYNIGVLEHFEDPLPLLKETFRILAPNGRVFMVIVPRLPYLNSAICRFLFHPLSLARYLLGRLLGRKRKIRDGDMIRTEINGEEYLKLAKVCGFSDVQCIGYNPYHQVCPDGIYLNRWVLFWYKLHYRLMGIVGRVPRFKVSNRFSLCLLLVATKPASKPN